MERLNHFLLGTRERVRRASFFARTSMRCLGKLVRTGVTQLPRYLKMWLPFLVVSLGILIMYFSWALDHPERHPSLVRFLDRNGHRVLSCYNALSDGRPIASDDGGFAQVVELLVRELVYTQPNRFLPQYEATHTGAELLQAGRLEVTAVSSVGEKYIMEAGGVGIGKAHLKDVKITLSIDQRDIQEVGPFDIASFRDELTYKYVDNPLFRWSFGLFIFGLAISVISAFAAMRRQNPTSYCRNL